MMFGLRVLTSLSLSQVEITLQDVNDNPPVFPTDSLDITIQENISDGFRILQLTATDADEVQTTAVTRDDGSSRCVGGVCVAPPPERCSARLIIITQDRGGLMFCDGIQTLELMSSDLVSR